MFNQNQSQRNEIAHREEAAKPVPQVRPVTPPVDIFENQDGILILSDMPGASKESLRVELHGQVLSVEADIGLQVPTGFSPLYTEWNAKRYARSFTLSRELDPERVEAELSQGVLKLTIPKSEASKPRKIDVKVH